MYVADAESTLVPLQTSGNLSPLYCVHPVSGSAFGYADLARALGGEQPVFGLEAPGFDRLDAVPTSIEDLALAHLDSLSGASVTGPVRLLGWSLGGIIALQMARVMAGSSGGVGQLTLIDPPLPVGGRVPTPQQILRGFVMDLLHASAGGPRAVEELECGELTDNVSSAFEVLQKAAVLSEEFDLALFMERYAYYAENVLALSRYAADFVYPGDVNILKASQSLSDDSAWMQLAPRATVQVLQGNHHSILQGMSLQLVVDLVQAGG